MSGTDLQCGATRLLHEAYGSKEVRGILSLCAALSLPPSPSLPPSIHPSVPLLLPASLPSALPFSLPPSLSPPQESQHPRVTFASFRARSRLTFALPTCRVSCGCSKRPERAASQSHTVPGRAPTAPHPSQISGRKNPRSGRESATGKPFGVKGRTRCRRRTALPRGDGSKWSRGWWKGSCRLKSK
eukprot:1470200-Rhodomonas_salina.2